MAADPDCIKGEDGYFYLYTTQNFSQRGEEGYGFDRCPIYRSRNLSGKLLLCHGTADDNVHFQNTAEYSEVLVQQGTQFDMQVYTNRNHGISGGNTRLHLFNRIENFFDSNLMK